MDPNGYEGERPGGPGECQRWAALCSPLNRWVVRSVARRFGRVNGITRIDTKADAGG